ncbi:hypothetical protein ACI2K4_09435 [Micromonospora sp. NPDC050397]|uniref:hypothetical protein n=1 Tax=Micromonospora sp. NPDC050397 TaxID=3364279 RepID=UPI00384D262D
MPTLDGVAKAGRRGVGRRVVVAGHNPPTGSAAARASSRNGNASCADVERSRHEIPTLLSMIVVLTRQML